MPAHAETLRRALHSSCACQMCICRGAQPCSAMLVWLASICSKASSESSTSSWQMLEVQQCASHLDC